MNYLPWFIFGEQFERASSHLVKSNYQMSWSFGEIKVVETSFISRPTNFEIRWSIIDGLMSPRLSVSLSVSDMTSRVSIKSEKRTLCRYVLDQVPGHATFNQLNYQDACCSFFAMIICWWPVVISFIVL